MDSKNSTRSQKLVHLSNRFRQSKSYSESKQSQRFKTPNRAAVLICLFEEEDDIYVILTKRSSKVSSFSGNEVMHSKCLIKCLSEVVMRFCCAGQVSLPGGRTDEGDTDDVHTALREVEEEIGLDPVLVDVVGLLEPFVSKGNVSVVPVMGILWDKQAFNPVLNVQEVESIFYAPFAMFLKDKNRRQEEIVFQEEKFLFHYFDHETNNKVYTIWAITAAILIVAASLFYQQTPDFQPRMPKLWNRNHSRL
ncbi:hypothetical protein R6Q57_015687 [Mikania cordata]